MLSEVLVMSLGKLVGFSVCSRMWRRLRRMRWRIRGRTDWRELSGLHYESDNFLFHFQGSFVSWSTAATIRVKIG